jgi:hypothetical protein
MTKLLKNAVAQLRKLPDDLQDKIAQQLIQYVNEISSPSDEQMAIYE